MASAMKGAIKRLLYACGALHLYHRLRNRNVLTVAMFHRVLSPEDPRWDSALPEITLTESVFGDCLHFFKRHYTVVGLPDVLASVRGERALPPLSLLLTFDDGYADNEEYALSALRRHDLPAVVFVFSDAVGQRNLPWTEDFLRAYLNGSITREEVTSVYGLLGRDGKHSANSEQAQVWEIVQCGPQLDEAEVQVALSQLRKPLTRIGDPAQMVSVEQVRSLVRHGVAIGAHGKTHTIFPAATNLAAELLEPPRVLERILAGKSQSEVSALSFPHGAHTSDIVDQALQEGYRLIFTIREELTPLTCGRLGTPVIGRINVNGSAVSPGGHLRPDLLAFHFFRRPHAKLAERCLRA